MNRALLVAAVMGLTMVGCAANVDQPVQQLPEPPHQPEAPVQTFGGDLHMGLTDPVMQALIDQTNSGFGDLPPKQLAVQLPGK